MPCQPSDGTRGHGASLLAVALLALGAVAAVGRLTPYGAATTPDSLNYIEAANHIRAGRGVALSTYSLTRADETEPFTTWPPLYPMALAVSALSAPIDALAAARLALVTLAASCVVLFLLLHPLVGYGPALLASVVLLVAPSTLIVFTYAWSESLFIPLALAALGCCLRCVSRDRPVGDRQYAVLILLLALLSAALFYCRYLGLTLGVWLALAWVMTPNRRARVWPFVAASALWVVAVVALLARNYLLSGDITGSCRAPPTRGLLGSLLDILVVGWETIVTPPLVAAGALAAALAVSVLRARCRQGAAPGEGNDRGRLLVLAVAGLTAYIGTIVIMRSIKAFDANEVRFLSPMLPLVLVLLALCVTHSSPTGVARRTLHLSAGLLGWWLILLLAAKGLDVLHHTARSLRESGVARFSFAAGRPVYSNYTLPNKPNRYREALDALGVSPGAIVVTDYPRGFQFVTGRQARQLPVGPVTAADIRTLNARAPRGCVIAMTPASQERWRTYLVEEANRHLVRPPGINADWLVLQMPLAEPATRR